MKRIIILCFLFCLLTLPFTGCSGDNPGDVYIGKEVTLSLKGGVDTVKGKVIDLKINEYITLDDDSYVFTVNLNNRKYRIVMEKEAEI